MRRSKNLRQNALGVLACILAAAVMTVGMNMFAAGMNTAQTQAEIIVAVLWMAVLCVPHFLTLDAGLSFVQHGLIRFSARALNVIFGVLFAAVKAMLTIALLIMCIAFCATVLTSLVMKAALPLALLYAAAAITGFVGVRALSRGLKKQWKEE